MGAIRRRPLTNVTAREPETRRARRRLPALGLPSKLLLLTIAFVMLAEVCIFVPSIANFRKNWLMERLTAAQIAALAVEVAPKSGLPARLRAELLNTAGVHGVASEAQSNPATRDAGRSGHPYRRSL